MEESGPNWQTKAGTTLTSKSGQDSVSPALATFSASVLFPLRRSRFRFRSVLPRACQGSNFNALSSSSSSLSQSQFVSVSVSGLSQFVASTAPAGVQCSAFKKIELHCILVNLAKIVAS